MPSVLFQMTQGPFCGILVTITLYGIICMQIFHYANNYASSDRKLIKWLIGGIWLLETIHTALSIHVLEYYLILHYSDPLAGCYVVWSMGATYICGFLVGCAVDMFFIWRIWILSNQVLICMFLAVLETARTGVGIANASLSFKYSNAIEFLTMVQPTIITEWILSASADSLIAITQCYYIHKQRSGMKSTDRVINKLLLYTINTGLLTSLFAIIVIITFLVIPDTMDYAAFVQVQSKLYAVSILASLNARKETLEAARKTDPVAVNASFEPHGHCRGEPVRRDQPSFPVIDIKKDVEEEMFPSGSTKSTRDNSHYV